MSFKCHRDPVQNGEVKVWTINAIATHPQYGTFATGGSDGTFHFWDKEAKSRLKGYPSVGGSISAAAFNGRGDVFAYAVSYDWHKGFGANSPDYPNKVMLHPIVDDEVKPKSLLKKRY
jgi:mRNA export factor